MSLRTHDELLKPKEVAQELHVHLWTVYRYIRQGKLPVIHLSAREFRIRRSELKRFLRERETDKAKE
jgi:excisionase family DNA binding protein